MKSKVAIIVQTAPMKESERAAYCREQGLYPEQLDGWRAAIKLADVRDEATAKVALAAERKKNKELERELHKVSHAKLRGAGHATNTRVASVAIDDATKARPCHERHILPKKRLADIHESSPRG